MPYIIRIPPTHDHLPATLHPFQPFGSQIGSLVALSSTSTLDLTLVHDFQDWGWQVRHIDVDHDNNAEDTTSARRSGSASQSDDGISVASVPSGSQATVQKWYDQYKRKDAKHGLRARVFRIWELEHGRRIKSDKVGCKEEDKGLKGRLSDLF